jgi:beta-lactamase superfamily II metal-dependent hydrolase
VKKRVGKRSAATGPNSATIRMYNVGFGDCFLLTFHFDGHDRHMLIDYGSTAAPKRGGPNYMTNIANDIKGVSNGKLDVLVATHRHRDHISGFATDGAGTGKIIAKLAPDYVIQPWTEDPATRPEAMTATTQDADPKANSRARLTAKYLGSLEDMHCVASSVAHLAPSIAGRAGKQKLSQLSFLGENNVKNLSAIKNLQTMAKKKHFYVNAGMVLPRFFPGVTIKVLGPPTLKQSDAIRSERAKDPNEFWQFRSFWSSQRLAASSLGTAESSAFLAGQRSLSVRSRTPNTRWFIEQSQKLHVDQVLEIVRELDGVMNNTSVILLIEFGERKLLFPGDAQIENWSYALSNPKWCDLLKDVNLYKVGHHGSLNATPKTLWKLFDHKGDQKVNDRLGTLCSTKSGKHGNATSGTEVPRIKLVDALKANSCFCSTETLPASEKLAHVVTIPARGSFQLC